MESRDYGNVGLFCETEAAQYLGCSIHKLRADRFYRRGVNYVKIGRCVRYRLEDLQAYVVKHTVSHGMEAA